MIQVDKINAGSNCYLITQNDVSILVDTGLKGFEKKILKQCEGKQVKLIVLTHGHIDHVQNAAYLAEKLQAPIAMHEKDVPLLENNLCRKMKAKGLFGNIVRFFSMQSAKSTKLEPFQIKRYLKEGDSLENIGVDAKILELPGHTAGSIGVIVGNALFVGDALMHMTTAGPSLLFEDYNQMIESVQKVQNQGDLEIYFGHGNMVKNRKWV